ncbi:NAD(P)H-binding protein [Nocardioidaceae bacterium]|nr:NAD(P)H-binding protein [Nocardioidaceae bacterium]
MQTAGTSSRPVAILGASGNVGSQALDLLRRQHLDARPLSSRHEVVQSWRRDGLDARRVDLDDPDARTALRHALTGVDTLLLIVAASPRQAAQGRLAVEAAVEAGVRRVVHLSSADGRVGSPVPWADACARTDALIRASGLTWTILLPTAFDVDLLELATPVGLGWLPQVAGDGAVGWVDVGDIARVATEVITASMPPGGAYDGRTLTLTGPELLGFGEVAQIMSSVLDRPVRHVDLPVPVFRTLLRLAGQDRWTTEAVIAQFADVVRHGKDGADVLTDTVREVTGRDPVPLAAFVDAHRDRFGRPSPAKSLVSGAARALRGVVSKTRAS